MIWLFIILIILVIGYLSLGFFFFNYSMNPRFSRKKLFKNRNEKLSSDNTLEWYKNTIHENIYITSFDSIKLHAYKFNSKTHKYVIISHGYTNNGLDMLDYAKHYSELNFNVILIDHRAHGKSDGKYSTMGINESKDIMSWINYIIDNDKKSKIILHGISMGSYAVMLSVARGNLPKNVLYAIEDCGFYSIYKQFYHQLKHEGHIPQVVISAANIFYMLILKVNIYKYDILKSLSTAKLPMLFIHGGKDKFVTIDYLEDVYNNYGGKKEKLIVDNAKHMKSVIQNEKLYWSTVDKFIDKNLIRKEEK